MGGHGEQHCRVLRRGHLDEQIGPKRRQEELRGADRKGEIENTEAVRVAERCCAQQDVLCAQAV